MPGQVFHGRRLEQVGGVRQRRPQAIFGLFGFQVQVELSGVGGPVQRLQCQARHVHGASAQAVLMVEHHLEQRVMAQAALGLQGFHQLLEWQVLMRLGLEGALLDLGQQLRKGHLPLQLGLQHLGVDEETHQPFGFQARAVGDRHADTDLGLTAVAMQHGLERGQQQHEQGHVLTLGQRLEFGHQRAVQMDLLARAAMALHCRARMVQRQLQHRVFTAQARAPVIELALFFPGRHPVTLPLGIVGVLDRQRRQCAVALVERHQLIDHHVHRPTVGDDVMLSDHQHMMLRRHFQQFDAHQRATAQVEGALDFLGHRLFDRPHIDALALDGHCQRWMDDLQGLLALFHKGGAQRLMALYQGLERVLQRGDVQLTAQVQGGGNVIGRAGGVQLPEEPLAFLGEGQRQRPAAFNSHQRLRRAHLQRRTGVGKRVQGRLFEQRTQWHFQVERMPYPGDHLGGQQRVAAALEEVILQADLLNLQHRLPDRRQLALQRGLWRHVGLGVRVQVRRRQCAAVKLAVVVQRQGIEHHPLPGHHVLRQRLTQTGRQCLCVQGDALSGHHVRHQLRARCARQRQYCRFTHLRQGLQAGLDFADFDTQAANLHLMVDTPDVLQRTRLVITGQVATAVEPRTGDGGKRVGQKALGGQRRAVEIALGQAGFGADAQFAHAIGRQQLETAVEHVERTPFNRVPDRHTERVAGIIQLARVHAGHHCCLGRPIRVDQPHSAQSGGMPSAQAFDGHRFTAHMHLAQLAQGATVHGAFLGQQVPVSGGQVGQGHALFDDLPRQLPGVPQVIATHDQRRAHAQRRVALFDKAVEAEGRELQHAVLCAQLAVHHGAVAELAEGGMVDGHAFGLASGAGGVDHVRQVRRCGVIGRIGCRAVGQLNTCGAELDTGQPGRQRHIGQQAGFAEQQVQATVREHVGQALGRVFRVQRHIGRAALEHRQQADDQLRTAPRRQAHALAGADAQFQQAVGQAVGSCVELGVAQAFAAGLHCQGVRRGLGLGSNALMGVLITSGGGGQLAEGKHIALHGGVKQAQIAQGDVSVGQQLRQQMLQVVPQPRDLRRAELRTVVAELQAQAGAQFDTKGQWVMGAFMVMQRPEGQAGRRALFQGFGHREVFKHQQGIEQRGALLAGPALDVVERHMLVITQAEVLRLQLAEPTGGRLRRRGGADDRQGIDEQAQLLLDPRQRRGTPGHGGAEGHASLPGVALQQQAPGTLQQGIEGHLVLAGELTEVMSEVTAQHDVMLRSTRTFNRRAQRLGQSRRRLQWRQLGFPECFAVALLLQPAQVIAKLPERCRHGLARIMSKHFAEQLGVAPAIHEDVVAGENQVPGGSRTTHQPQAKQRRGVEFEAALTLGVGQGIEIGMGVFNHLQLQVDLALDHLMRAVQAQPMEAAAQDVVAVQRGLPGAPEREQIEAVDVQPQLVDIGLGLGLQQRVEQHALLHRRQRVNIRDGRPGHRQCIQLRLGDACQGEIRWRDLPGRRGTAMFDQGLEFSGVFIRQALDGRGVEHFATEAPLQGQLTAIHLPFHRQPVGQRRIRVLSLATALAGRHEQRRLIELAVELAQVIEGNAWCGQPGQGFADLRRAEVAQQAIAQALVGDGAQLLLDRLDCAGQLAIGLQAQRKQAGEPADGAGQVDALEQVFATMPLQFDQRGGLTAPTTDHPRQGGEQQVVDLGAIGRRRLLQQLARMLGIEARFQLGPQAILQAALRVIARQLGIDRLRLPVRQLVIEGLRMVLQPLRPVLVGTGLCRQRLFAISLLQVFQQDAPGHPVHHQMVHHQQQTLGTVGHVDQNRAQQRALLQIEAALGLIAQRGQFGVAAGMRQPQH
ncbi:hypothetical protein [Pseudomonas sp. 37 R 15]|nr:hypothetical protein [Pseudomonas sp. 37 R 15]